MVTNATHTGTESPAPRAGTPSSYTGRANRPVFVGGCPRSGTTLLRTMLNTHPALAMPHETRFLIAGWERRAIFGDLSDPQNRRRVAKWIARRPKSRLYRLGLEPDELIAALDAAPPTIGSVLGAPFAAYAQRHQKERWGDKRPSHAQHLDAIFAMFPHAQFVNMVRDPRAAVASVRKIGWYGGDVTGGAALWLRSVRAVDRWRRRLAPDQLLDLQYEELVHEPRRSLGRIAIFLALAPEGIEAMMRFHENSDVPTDPTFHPRIASPVTTDAVRAWEATLTKEEVAFIEHVLGDQMRRYGYEPDATGTPFPDDMVQRYRRLLRQRFLKDLGQRLGNAKLKLTYRYPVAAQRSATS
jgi:hypothetical protein